MGEKLSYIFLFIVAIGGLFLLLSGGIGAVTLPGGTGDSCLRPRLRW